MKLQLERFWDVSVRLLLKQEEKFSALTVTGQLFPSRLNLFQEASCSLPVSCSDPVKVWIGFVESYQDDASFWWHSIFSLEWKRLQAELDQEPTASFQLYWVLLLIYVSHLVRNLCYMSVAKGRLPLQSPMAANQRSRNDFFCDSAKMLNFQNSQISKISL